MITLSPSLISRCAVHSSHLCGLRQAAVALALMMLTAFAVWLLLLLPGMKGIAGYLPLHMLLETMAIVVAMLLFATGWQATRQRSASLSFLVLTCGYFAVAVLDFSHMLSFTGMPDFVTPSGAEKAINFWLFARTLAVVSLLLAVVLPWREMAVVPVRRTLMFGVIVFLVGVHWILLYHDVMPHTFIPGQGLTAFKVNFEYALIILCLITALMLWWRMRDPLPFHASGLFGAICSMALSEYMFTLYAEVTDLYNLLGHLFKVVAYWFLYRAVFIEAIELPYRQLAQEHRLLEEIVDNIPSLIALRRVSDLRFELINRRGGEWFGCSPDELKGHLAEEVFDQDHVAFFAEGDRELPHHDGMVEMPEQTIETSSGKRILRIRKMVFRDEQGEPLYLLGVADDVTEQRHLEMELHGFNELLQGFILHSPIYAYIKEVSPDASLVVVASENFREMVGIPGEKMIGKTMTELFPPEFAARISADDWAVVSGGSVLKLDEDLNGRNYTTIKFPIFVGGKSYLAGYTIDITEREQMMAELEQHRDKLEEMVAARTLELRAANKELEAFSYSVSHDLRAPLRAIAGFVELLKKHNYDAIDDKGKHYMDVIAEAAVQMGQLIDDILTFSRIGRVEMNVSRVDMNRLLAEVCNTLLQQAEERRIEWKMAPLPEVLGERTMLSLVLQNLLSNALKFTRNRDAAVIEIGTAVGSPDETVYYVRDNGVGFDMRHVDKLFGLFQRLHTQEQFEGSGVGLANVQRIVQRHGGRVWAEGRVGEGATFYFALPKSGG